MQLWVAQNEQAITALAKEPVSKATGKNSNLGSVTELRKCDNACNHTRVCGYPQVYLFLGTRLVTFFRGSQRGLRFLKGQETLLDGFADAACTFCERARSLFPPVVTIKRFQQGGKSGAKGLSAAW